jgi:hypothetical protein
MIFVNVDSSFSSVPSGPTRKRVFDDSALGNDCGPGDVKSAAKIVDCVTDHHRKIRPEESS